jgi:pyruvate dehydrogenase complex dehydrogenase (E1) component
VQGSDIDPTETREWVDALQGVIEVEGPERARYLLERVLDSARRKGAPVPYSANTPYSTGKGGAAPRRSRNRAPHPLLYSMERTGNRAAGE